MDFIHALVIISLIDGPILGALYFIWRSMK
jgi:hypothetical protein